MPRFIYTAAPKTGSITVSKVITGLPLDETYFLVTLTGQSAEPTIVSGYVNQTAPIIFDDLPFDTYVVTEETLEGYTLDSIVSDTIVLSRGNRRVACLVTNEKDIVIETIKYGSLYNPYTVSDIRGLARSGYSIPTHINYLTLDTYLTNAISAREVKEDGTTYWNDDMGLNTVNMNVRGTGFRVQDGSFFGIKNTTVICCSDSYFCECDSDNDSMIIGSANFNNNRGYPIRLFRLATSPELLLADGIACTPYYDGEYYYRTVKIGTQVWVADNIKTRFYSNGDPIPLVTDNSAWAALTTGAMCYYDNDINNA